MSERGRSACRQRHRPQAQMGCIKAALEVPAFGETRASGAPAPEPLCVQPIRRRFKADLSVVGPAYTRREVIWLLSLTETEARERDETIPSCASSWADTALSVS